MNLDEMHRLPPHHRANAERQLCEQRNPHITMPRPTVYQMNPDGDVCVELPASKPPAALKPGISNGFNQAVLNAWLLDHGIRAPCYEFLFHPSRKWRFDLAWPLLKHKVALEVQGGLFTGGAHVRGAALLREHDKLNEAAALGWRILYRTPQNLMTAATAELIKRALA